MIELKQSNLSLEELVQSPSHAPLILPSLFPSLHSPSRYSQWLAAEAWIGKMLAGLILVEIYPLTRLAQLESLVVHERFKDRGIGRALFAFAEDLLAQQEKMEAFECKYDASSSYGLEIENIVTSLGWTPPPLFLVRIHFDAIAFNPPWIQRSQPLPQTMQFFPWSDLRSEDREWIKHLEVQGHFISYLSPFDRDDIDLETSVGLRSEGKVVGWSITERPDPQTIRYSSLYVDHHLAPGGWGIQLLMESIRKQKQLAIPHAYFAVNVKDIDLSWRKFIKKRLLPLADRVEWIKQAYKVFPENL